MFNISGVHAWTAAVLADETQGAWFLQLPVGEEQWHWQTDTARWYALLYASWGLHGNHWTTHEKCKNHKKLSFPFRLNIIVILGILPCYIYDGHFAYQIFMQVSIFATADAAFLRHLTLMMKPCIFLPGEYIVHKGDMGLGMFFLYHGTVS